ncbi:MAG: hypothetical protein ABTQ25_01795 [Nitrosomonas ureae]
MRNITVPGWLKSLPGDSSLNNRDIASLFGYSVKTSSNQLIKDGLLPKPSWNQKGLSCSKKHQWYVKDVIKFINQKGISK